MITKKQQTSALVAKAVTASLMVALIGIAPFARAQTASYPDETTTGVPPGTQLTIVNGSMTISTSGTIVENKDVRGCITVSAANVIIRKSKVSCGGSSVIRSNSTNLIVEDVEIVCGGTNGTTGLTPGNYTARRVNAHSCENIMWVDDNVLIEDSYLHDPIPYDPATDPHTDSIQMDGSNNTIRHNRIYGGYNGGTNFGSSAMTTGYGLSNILIENNIFAGGGYSLRCSEQGGGNVNYRVLNNRFSRIFVSTVGGFGPVNECENKATQYSGNVYHETGQLLPEQTPLVTPSPPVALSAL